jgi:hypothetical protein
VEVDGVGLDDEVVFAGLEFAGDLETGLVSLGPDHL